MNAFQNSTDFLKLAEIIIPLGSQTFSIQSEFHHFLLIMERVVKYGI